MNYKIIFVEGLPGTGKTTLTEQISNSLREKGIPVKMLQEGDRIPSNFNNIAGIPKNIIAGSQEDMDVVAKTENYIFVDMDNCAEKAKQLQCYDIGNAFNPHISAYEYARCTLEWWRYWVDNNIKESILILDSALLQCPTSFAVNKPKPESTPIEWHV